jgi:competence protein ComFB
MKLITKDIGAAGESPEPVESEQASEAPALAAEAAAGAVGTGEGAAVAEAAAVGTGGVTAEGGGAVTGAAAGAAAAGDRTNANAAAAGDRTNANAAAGGDGIEASVKTPETKELNYKTKLKIEIEPEIEIKNAEDKAGGGSVRTAIGTKAGGGGAEAKAIGSAAPEEGYAEGAAPHAHRGVPTIRKKADDDAPDGVPYENRDDWRLPAYPQDGAYMYDAGESAGGAAAGHGDGIAGGFAAGGKTSAGGFTARPGDFAASGAQNAGYDPEAARRESEEQKASAKQQDERRRRKIMIENELLSSRHSLVNLSEVLTKELLPSVMEKMGVCTCRVCTTNVLALTLNSLPAKYVTTDKGKQYTQLEVYKSQYELDVLAALTKACLKVKSYPRHEIIEDDIDI